MDERGRTGSLPKGSVTEWTTCPHCGRLAEVVLYDWPDKIPPDAPVVCSRCGYEFYPWATPRPSGGPQA